jgi:hypothetical protein
VAAFFVFTNFYREGNMDTIVKTQHELMSRTEAASYLRICKTTLDRLEIPRTQIRKRVLYRKATLDNWLASQETAGAKQ